MVKVNKKMQTPMQTYKVKIRHKLKQNKLKKSLKLKYEIQVVYFYIQFDCKSK